MWIAAVLLLVAGTTLPGSMKAAVEARMWSGLPWSASAHFILFAVIAAIPVYGEGRMWVLRAAAVAILLALVTETLQRFVPGRHPMVRDGLIDIAGAGIGTLGGIIWSRRKSTRTKLVCGTAELDARNAQ